MHFCIYSHGRIVGLNVAKKQSEKVKIKTVPFFWTGELNNYLGLNTKNTIKS